jgi:hypothetical protein
MLKSTLVFAIVIVASCQDFVGYDANGVPITADGTPMEMPSAEVFAVIEEPPADVVEEPPADNVVTEPLVGDGWALEDTSGIDDPSVDNGWVVEDTGVEEAMQGEDASSYLVDDIPPPPPLMDSSSYLSLGYSDIDASRAAAAAYIEHQGLQEEYDTAEDILLEERAEADYADQAAEFSHVVDPLDNNVDDDFLNHHISSDIDLGATLISAGIDGDVITADGLGADQLDAEVAVGNFDITPFLRQESDAHKNNAHMPIGVVAAMAASVGALVLLALYLGDRRRHTIATSAEAAHSSKICLRPNEDSDSITISTAV